MVRGHGPESVQPGSGGEADDRSTVIIAAVTSRSERPVTGGRLTLTSARVTADEVL